MSVAANVISAVVKSVVGDKVGDGLAKELADISIDGISENGIDKINDFISGKKAKMEHILSKESMRSMNIPENIIDHVVEEIKDLFKSIEITDEVLRQCKYDSMNLSAFLWNEYCVHKDDSYIEHESETKRCLFAVAEVLIKLVRESETFQQDVSIHISNSVDDINIGLQKISEYMEDNFDKLDADHQMILDILRMILEQNREESTKNKDNIQKVKSRTQEYLDKWNANMFLNDFSEWDENAGVNVKLKDVYIEAHLPHFKYGHSEKEYDNLDILLSKYIIKTNENKMLLILGQPGIGKSTLITWIVTKFNGYIENILVYKFADDLKNVDWQNPNVSERILEALNLSYNDLDGKTLILDGFDEVSIGVNRKEVLDNLYGELIYKKNIEKFSLIITCRENYIQKFERVKCNYIILQPWDEIQITSFCNIYHEKAKNSVSDGTKEKLVENKEILGIPLILYMVLALDISIEKDSSIVDVYDKIFSLEGGIYDRCIDNKKFAGNHRIGEVKEYIHQISREIAIWMFENNPDEACIPQEEYEKICDYVMKDYTYEKEDFKIGNFFKSVKHCEGTETEKLSFVHRSIYEYFVVETIYNAVIKPIERINDENHEELAEDFVFYLKEGDITYTIGEFLLHKISKLYSKLDNDKKQKFYQWWESAVYKMMKAGMFYYTKRNIEDYKKIMDKESKCFLNIIKILRLLLCFTNNKYIMESINRNELAKWIKYCLISNENCDFSCICLCQANFHGAYLKKIILCQANLKQVYMSNAYLNEANLKQADLSKAFLVKASLKQANLMEANLMEAVLFRADLKQANLIKSNMIRADLRTANLCCADLKDATLIGADLGEINLEGADIRGTIFDEGQIDNLKEQHYCLQDVKVYIARTGDIISYKDYCKSKQ